MIFWDVRKLCKALSLRKKKLGEVHPKGTLGHTQNSAENAIFVKFDRNFCMCRLSANTFSKYISPKGLYMKESSCQIFCPRMELRYQFSFVKNEFSEFSRFLIFVNFGRNSVRNFRKSRKKLGCFLCLMSDYTFLSPNPYFFKM